MREVTAGAQARALLIKYGVRPVSCRLAGEDGNAFAIGGRIGAQARREGWPKAAIDAMYEMMQAAPSYDALLQMAIALTDSGEQR